MYKTKQSYVAVTKRIMTVLGMISVSATGCATLTNGTMQIVPISSAPSGAIVRGAGVSQRTPCMLRLSRARDHMLTITKAGYEGTTVYIVRSPTGAIAGNVLVGGLIGMGVDLASGANNHLVPASVYVHLQPLEQHASVTRSGAFVRR